MEAQYYWTYRPSTGNFTVYQRRAREWFGYKWVLCYSFHTDDPVAGRKKAEAYIQSLCPENDETVYYDRTGRQILDAY